MNKAKLKSYAPQARKDFIAAVVARANLLGIAEKNGKLDIVPSEQKGDVTLIAGQAWPAKVHEQRERLIKRMQKIGAGETAEAIAYTCDKPGYHTIKMFRLRLSVRNVYRPGESECLLRRQARRQGETYRNNRCHCFCG